MSCYFCEKNPREYYVSGYWCNSCRKLKNLGNVYGFERVLEILEKCCIRNPEQLEKKISVEQKPIKDADDGSVIRYPTRNKKNLEKI